MTLAASRAPELSLAGLTVKVETALDEVVYTVAPEHYRDLCERLAGEGFDFPRCLTGSDMEYGLRVTLHLQQLEGKRKAVVRTDLPYERPRIPSVTDLWGGVEWHEREAYDLVGITFEGHPDLRRILLEDDWTIHPLQRKYNTRGYVIPEWQAKPFPVPAPWETAAPAEAAPPAVTATATAAGTPVPAPATPAAPVSAPAAPAPAAAAVPAEGERVRKPPKKWVPKGQSPESPSDTAPEGVDVGRPSSAVPSASGSEAATGAPPADPDFASREDPSAVAHVLQPDPGLPSSDPAQVGQAASSIPSPTADVSAGRNFETGAAAPTLTGEPISQQTGVTPLDAPVGSEPAPSYTANPDRPRNPKIKRWEPKKPAGEGENIAGETPSGNPASEPKETP